jgi:uncharacterized Zn-finger protein
MKTCTKDNCDRPHRARGLCSSHYNQEHQPNRHAKKMVACAWCGTEVLKGTGGGRKHGAVCSNECRQWLQNPYCVLPADHWARWYGRTSAWPHTRNYTWAPQEFGSRTCDYCSDEYTARAANQRFCATSCSARWHHDERVRNRGGMQSVAILAMPRNCAHCDQPYNHASKQRIHCSDLCRDEAKAARGGTLFHGWIADSVRLSIYERDDYTCWLCHDKVDMQADRKRDDWAPSLDHVTPRSKGGTHAPSNLLTAHRWCNSVRSDNEQHELFTEAA